MRRSFGSSACSARKMRLRTRRSDVRRSRTGRAPEETLETRSPLMETLRPTRAMLARFLYFHRADDGSNESAGSDLDRHRGQYRSPDDTGLRPAALPGAELSLGTWLLGVGTRRLLLGAGNVGCRACNRSALDAGVLALEDGRILLVPWLLGPDRRILRRNQLWIRLFRRWIRWRLLERRQLLL
jgi:hypothetical protein